MATEVAEAPAKSAKRTGWGLLILALASPLIMGAAGIISAGKAGELIVQVGFAWLMTAVVIDLVLKKRDGLTKANGRIVAAILALLMALASGFTFYRDEQKVDTGKKELIEQFMTSTVDAKAAVTESASNLPESASAESRIGSAQAGSATAAPVDQAVAGSSEADRAVAMIDAMKLRAKQFTETSAALNRKFNAIDLSTVLAPQNLLRKTDIQASRKTLEGYKGLIQERDAMLKHHFALSEQIIRGAGLSEREVNNGMAGLNSNKGPISQNYAELTSVQFGSVKASSDLLNFAERGLGRITIENGQLMFQTQPELEEYRSLMQALTDAAAKEDAVTQKVNAQAQKSKQSLVDEFKK